MRAEICCSDFHQAALPLNISFPHTLAVNLNAWLGFFYLMSVPGWCCVSKVIFKEKVLSEGRLITTALIVFHKYFLVGDNPNPLVFSESLETSLLIIAYRPKMLFRILNLTKSQDKFK